MEDQGKRLLIAVAVAFGIMLVWSMLFPPEKPEQKPEQKNPPAAATADQAKGDAGAAAAPVAEAPDQNAPGATAPGAATPASGTAPAKPVEVAPRGPAELVEFKDSKQVDVTFSSHSAAVVSWRLKGEKFEDRAGGKGEQLDLVPTHHGDALKPEALGLDPYALVVGFAPDSDIQMPAETQWKVDSRSKNEITFSWKSPDFRVLKKFKLIPEDYLLSLSVDIEKLSPGEAKQTLVISSFRYQDPNEKGGRSFLRRIDPTWHTGCDIGGTVKSNSAKYLERGAQTYPGNVKWAGFTHGYFLTAFSPKPNPDNQLTCVASEVKDHPGVMRVDLVFGPAKKLKQGDVYGRTVTAYFGPKYLGKLDSLSAHVGYSTGFEDAIDLGWFSMIARPLLWLLQWFQSIVVNWGVAIILLTLVVKLATLYWTNKSMRSMRAMSLLKPEVEKIQKKYKDDKQRQQVEIMALYKAHNVSPLSGCLPMLLQMPIWFALYRTLMVAAELYQAPFIPGWIDDLTGPDPYYVLPIALTAMMFVQAKLSPSVPDSTQQKLMMYGMPIMFGVFSFMFPAGLTLYIFTNTALTAVHHVWMKRTEDRETAAAKLAKAKPGEAAAGSASTTEDDGDSDREDQSRAEPGPARPQRSGAKSRKRSGQRKRSNKRKRSA